MSESKIQVTLERVEVSLRNVKGQNLFTQQVRDFSQIRLEIPESSETRSMFEQMKEGLLSESLEYGLPLSPELAKKFHFALGRLNFLLDAQEQARVHFHEAARNGLYPAIAFYNLAMTFAADLELDPDEKKKSTTGFLQMIVDDVGLSSRPGMEAALHIKLIEKSKFQ